MVAASTEELLLVALAGSGADGDARSGGPRALEWVLDRLGHSGRLSDQVSVLTAIDGLRDDGLLERTTTAEGRTAVGLTHRGASRAAQLRQHLAETILRDEGEPVSAAALAEREDRPLVAVLGACDDAGDYRPVRAREPDGIVDREGVRGAWAERLEAVCDRDTGRAVGLVGPPGIGKTTLAEHLLERASDRFDLRVERATCRRTGTPYHPVLDWLSGLADGTDPLAGIDHDVDDADAYAARRTALYHRLTERLSPDPGEPTRVLFVDDLHRADEATLSYLAFLLERLEAHRIVVLYAARPTTRHEDASLDPAAPDEAGVLETFELDPFDREDTGTLVQRVLGRRRVAADFLAALQERTGGNPMFVEAAVETMVEDGSLDPDMDWYPADATDVPLPDRVHRAVARQFEHLGSDVRSVLRWAAVVGDTVPVAVLAAVADGDPDHVRTAVDVLREVGVFAPGSDEDALAFRSTVQREALLEQLAPAERRRHHRAVARAVERSLGDGDDAGTRAATVADHYERGGLARPAIRWYRRAADDAMAVFANDSAVRYCQSALSLAREHDDDETLRAVGERLAEIQKVVGHFEAADRYVRFVRERTPDGDRHRRQRLALLAAGIANMRGDYDTACMEVESGLALAEGPTALTCELLVEKTSALCRRSDYETAAATADRLRTTAAEIGEDVLAAKGRRWAGEIARRRERYDAAAAHFQAALETLESADEDAVSGNAYNGLGTVANNRGEYEAAREYYEHARERFRAAGDRPSVASVSNNLAIVAWRQGDRAAAVEDWQRALDEHRRIGATHAAADAQFNLGTAAKMRGDFGRAAEHFEEALSNYCAVGDRHRVAKTRKNRASVAIERADFDRATSMLEDALDTYRDIDVPARVAETETLAATVDRLTGRFASADDRLTTALRLARTAGNDEGLVLAALERGLLARDGGDDDLALAHLRAAARIGAGVVQAPTHAMIWNALASVHRRRGDTERVQELLADALETFREVEDDFGTAVARLRRGQCRCDAGDLEAAREDIAAARDRFDALGTPLWRARAVRAAGSLLARQDCPDAAREEFEDAWLTFEDLGAVPDALATLEAFVPILEESDREQRAADLREHARAMRAEVPDGEWAARSDPSTDPGRRQEDGVPPN